MNELQQEIEQDIYLEPKEIDWEKLAKDLGAQLVETAKLLEYNQGGKWQEYLGFNAKGLLSQVGLIEGEPDFQITYFKASGKFYTEGRISFPEAFTPEGKAYMYTARDKIKAMRSNGEPLPGLRRTWEGFILVEHPWGWPIGIPPIE